MSDFLATGTSALLAYRRALDTTGHNIANVNTPGYSRQRVELSARGGEPDGGGFVGNGVSVVSTQRLASSLIASREQSDASAWSRLDTFHRLATRLDGVLSDPATGLAQPLNELFTAFNTLASDPQSSAARQVVLSRAQSLAARFNDLHGQMAAQSSEIDARLRQGLAQLNQLSGSVAQLNQRIALASGAAGGQPPNDLLDQRDELVRQMSAQISLNAVVQDDGQLSVFTGSGQALVLGAQSFPLGTRQDPSGVLSITFGSGAATVDITTQVSGGAIGGLLDYRRELLAPAQLQLGQIAQALAGAVNAQQAQGADADGNAGAALFTDLSAVAAEDAAGLIAVSLRNPRGLAAAQAGSPAGSSDNRNARALSAIAQSAVLNGDTLSQSNSSLVSGVGSQASGAQRALDAAAAIQAQTLAERDSVSGVNLDEEAANLLRFQQAYQAAAQIISTANTIFQTLLDAARR